MALIVINHVVYSLYSPLFLSPIKNGAASPYISHILVNFMSIFGHLGNVAFIIISSWFLLDSKQVKIKKMIYFFISVWLMSILFLIGFFIFYRESLGLNGVVHSLFPNLFGSNWFITCYLIIYGVHTTLNKVIEQFSKEGLLNISLSMFLLFIFLNNINPRAFFPSQLILWCTLYFMVGYMKYYLPNLANNKKFNYLVLFSSILGLTLVFIVMNFLGLKYEVLDNQIFRLKSNNCIFLVFAAVALFNICRTLKIKTILSVNKIASYMLLVYVIHENILFRSSLRPLLLNYGYEFLGRKNLVLLVLLFSGVLFIVSILLAVIFDGIFRKLLKKATDILYNFLSNAYAHLQKYLLKLN